MILKRKGIELRPHFSSPPFLLLRSPADGDQTGIHGHPSLTIGGIRDRRFYFFTSATTSDVTCVLQRAIVVIDGCKCRGDRRCLFVGSLTVAA